MGTTAIQTCSSSSSKHRLVLFPLPFQGHVNPMIQLAHILHSQGFSITFIHTDFNFPDTSNYPHFTFHAIPDLESVELDGRPVTDPVTIVKILNAVAVEPFSRCLHRLLSEDGDGKVRCLITDANWFFSQDVADKFKIPRVVMRTSSICSFLAFAALPILREKGYLCNRDRKMDEQVADFPPLKVKDIPLIDMYDNPEVSYKMIGNMVQATTRASGIIFNTFRELEEQELAKLQRQYVTPAFVIGPFHKCFSAASTSLFEQDRTAITWLDTQAPKSVLYVSFGSVVSIEEQMLHEMAWGLASSMQPFLWVVRPGLVVSVDSEWSEVLPQGFMEAVGDRAKIVKWAPQQEVLSHGAVGGFWTHCGWNSTLESICEGVPMICSCFFGDQMVNSRYVNDVWEIGIKLEEGFDRGEIECAIRKLMVEEAGDEIRKRSAHLKERIDLYLSSGLSLHSSLVEFITSL